MNLGDLMDDFGGIALDGRRRRLSDLRGDREVVVLFMGDADDSAARSLLKELAKATELLVESDTALLVVTVAPGVLGADLAEGVDYLWVDSDGNAHRRAGAVGPDGRLAPRVFVLDRFHTVFLIHNAGEGLPTSAAVLNRVVYVAMLCPE